jgi:hypothetical protein
LYVIIYSIYMVWTVILLDVLIDGQRDYLPIPFWTIERVGHWVLILLFICTINWMVLNLKPSKR